MVEFRTAYNDKYVDPGIKMVNSDGSPQRSLAIQSERDNCDVNLIVDRFQKTGVLPTMNKTPQYGDFSQLPDYQESLNTVIAAQKAFMTLDARIRKQFDNNPAEFLDFVDDPKNGDKLIEWGLRKGPDVPSVGPNATALPEPDKKA